MTGTVKAAVIVALAMGISAALGGCGKKEEPAPPATNPPTAAPATSPAPAKPVVDSSRADRTASAPPPAAADTSAAPSSTTSASGRTSGAECCDILADSALGRLGRLVIAFPEGGTASSSPVAVFKSGDKVKLQTGYGAQVWDLIPGPYAVSLSGKRIEGVTIQSGHDTQLRVGTLRIKTGSSTAVALMDADDKTKLHSGYGPQEIGLPVGTYRVQIAGQSEAVTIRKGKITDY
ncbi:MAG: hypothetical protein ACR2OG_11750 [Gemmatimonadaceae bacterium]